jgi:hypothetical protein
MSLLQQAFNSASTTPPCPRMAATCSAVYPSCKDGGVSRQSGAHMLHCCPYRESNTQIQEGGKDQGIRYTQPKIITRIYVYMYHVFVVKAALACNAKRRKHTPVRPHTHTHTHKHTHMLSLSPSLSFSLSLSLSLTHTHTHTHTYAQAHTRKPKYAEHMSLRQKTHQASYTSRLRPQTLEA